MQLPFAEDYKPVSEERLISEFKRKVIADMIDFIVENKGILTAGADIVYGPRDKAVFSEKDFELWPKHYHIFVTMLEERNWSVRVIQTRGNFPFLSISSA